MTTGIYAHPLLPGRLTVSYCPTVIFQLLNFRISREFAANSAQRRMATLQNGDALLRRRSVDHRICVLSLKGC
jgi:hypothetical protein